MMSQMRIMKLTLRKTQKMVRKLIWQKCTALCVISVLIMRIRHQHVSLLGFNNEEGLKSKNLIMIHITSVLIIRYMYKNSNDD